MAASTISQQDIEGAAEMFASMVQDQVAELHEVGPNDIDHGEIMNYILKTDLPRIYCEVTQDAIMGATPPTRPPALELKKLLNIIESQSSSDIELYLKQHSYRCFVGKEIELDWGRGMGLLKKYSKNNDFSGKSSSVLKSESNSLGERILGFLHIWRIPHKSSENGSKWNATCWLISDDYNFSLEELHKIADSDIVNLFSSWRTEDYSLVTRYELDRMFKEFPKSTSMVPFVQGGYLARPQPTYQTTVIIF